MLKSNEITKRYDEINVLDNVSIQVEPGELLCLLGANGAGKTTLINIFMGFTQPDYGQVTVNDMDVHDDVLNVRKQVAHIPENVALYSELTAYEHLDLFSVRRGEASDRMNPDEALETVGLDKRFFRKRIKTYSKGMRQKVGLALALMRNASAILMDEPLAGLDPSAAAEFSDCVVRFKSSGAAILMATHDIFHACEIATKVAILRSGRLIDVIDASSVSAAQLEEIYLNYMR